MEVPDTRYVTVGEAQVAYQVAGDGPIDLLWSYGVGGHIDLLWLEPRTRRALEGLASFSRLILFDHRGVGASDALQPGEVPPWEVVAEDMTAVLDAAKSQKAALVAGLEAGPIALLYAATHPDRVTALILRNTTAHYLRADGYEIGVDPAEAESVLAMVESLWGTEELTRLGNPGLADDAEFNRWQARINRASVTPRTAAAHLRYWHQLDVRRFLPLVKVPTLVLHAAGQPLMPVEHGRYLADHISGAKLIESPGGDIGQIGNDETVADIAEFLIGERPAVEVDRILTTVLFSDIAASTERAASIGDRRWRQLLEAHDLTVRDQLRRFRGHEINTTGDGFIASFDGPGRAIRCSKAIIEATSKLGVELRIGLHTGECEVRGHDLAGLAVHIAARIAAIAQPGEVLVSSPVTQLVTGIDIPFADRGEHTLKGVPGTWHLFAVSP